MILWLRKRKRGGQCVSVAGSGAMLAVLLYSKEWVSGKFYRYITLVRRCRQRYLLLMFHIVSRHELADVIVWPPLLDPLLRVSSTVRICAPASHISYSHRPLVQRQSLLHTLSRVRFLRNIAQQKMTASLVNLILDCKGAIRSHQP